MTTSGFQLLLEINQHAGAAMAIGISSACGFAVANALQHRVAGTVPPSVRRAPDVLRHLTMKPVWLAATLVSFVAMVLHAVALRIGSIALVQPLMLVGVVLAVPLRAALERKLPPWRELRAVLVTVIGLGVFLWCANTAPSHATPRLATALVLALSGVATAVGALRACRARFARDPRLQAGLLGIAAGVLFGMTAGLLKLIGNVMADGRSGGYTLPVLFLALCGLGVLGTALNQRAYQIAPISFSMPVVNVVDVAIAVLFGALVFHELPGHTPVGLVLQLGALGCIAVGLRGIAHLERGAWCPERARATAGSR
jgi:drug/metabolite transporter (DMT)-like permease